MVLAQEAKLQYSVAKGRTRLEARAKLLGNQQLLEEQLKEKTRARALAFAAAAAEADRQDAEANTIIGDMPRILLESQNAETGPRGRGASPAAEEADTSGGKSWNAPPESLLTLPPSRSSVDAVMDAHRGADKVSSGGWLDQPMCVASEFPPVGVPTTAELVAQRRTMELKRQKELKRQMATTKLETREAARLWKREEFRERQRLEREAIDARNRIEDQRKADEIRYLKEALKQSQKEAMPADAWTVVDHRTEREKRLQENDENDLKMVMDAMDVKGAMKNTDVPADETVDAKIVKESEKLEALFAEYLHHLLLISAACCLPELHEHWLEVVVDVVALG